MAPDTSVRESQTLHLRLPHAAQRDELRRRLAALPRTDRSANEIKKGLGDQRTITLTFDQETAAERRDIAFITPVHALARVASQYWQERSDPLVVQLSLTEPSIVAGRYLFAIERWEELASRPAARLVGIAVRLDDASRADPVSDRLLDLVRSAESIPDAAPVPVSLEARQALDRQAHDLRRQAIATLQETNAALLDQRLASLDLYYRGLLAQLDGVLSASADIRITRMKTSERERREAEHARRRAELEGHRDADIISERIAVGVIEVTGDG